jgi:hypothetical protein
MSLWLFIPPFDCHLCLGHLQDLTESELAEMPSCNLAESMHNKWNQQFANRYHQYLKGDRTGTGPGKEELQLRTV